MGMSGDDERGEAVLSLHMRGLLGHPAGVRPSNHSRSIGNRPGSIISLTSHGPSFPPCVGAAGIFQGEPSSARCQYLFFYWICKWAAVSTRLRRAGRGPICVRGVVTNLIFIRWSLHRTVEWYRSQALADKTWIHSIIRAEWRSPLRDRRMTISIVSLWWCKAAQAIRAPIYPVVRRIMSALILMNILDLIVEKNMCCFVFAEIICL